MVRSAARRIAVLVLGWVLVLLGIAGLALPFLQGILLILLGLLVLSRESAWARRQTERLRRRFPNADARLHRARERLARWLPFLRRE
jgi:hypothetical protein